MRGKKLRVGNSYMHTYMHTHTHMHTHMHTYAHTHTCTIHRYFVPETAHSPVEQSPRSRLWYFSVGNSLLVSPFCSLSTCTGRGRGREGRMVGKTGRAAEEMEGRGALFVPYLSTSPLTFRLFSLTHSFFLHLSLCASLSLAPSLTISSSPLFPLLLSYTCTSVQQYHPRSLLSSSGCGLPTYEESHLLATNHTW